MRPGHHVALIGGLLAVALSAGCNSTPPASTQQTPAPETVAESAGPAPAYLGELPPLPDIGGPPPRPMDVVQAVFTFAARHPEVLHYVPCFCGCQHAGHRNNDDCFVAGRDPDGKPRWEPHGMT